MTRETLAPLAYVLAPLAVLGAAIAWAQSERPINRFDCTTDTECEEVFGFTVEQSLVGPFAIDRDGIRCVADTDCLFLYGVTVKEALEATAPAAVRTVAPDSTIGDLEL